MDSSDLSIFFMVREKDACVFSRLASHCYCLYLKFTFTLGEFKFIAYINIEYSKKESGKVLHTVF